MKTAILALFAFWFVIQSESGQLLEVGPFLLKERCEAVQETVRDAKVIIPCFFGADRGHSK